MLKRIQEACKSALSSTCDLYKEIFHYDISSATINDMDKPLYSGLMIFLYILSLDEPIPENRREQAIYWRKHVNLDGKLNDYLTHSDQILGEFTRKSIFFYIFTLFLSKNSVLSRLMFKTNVEHVVPRSIIHLYSSMKYGALNSDIISSCFPLHQNPLVRAYSTSLISWCAIQVILMKFSPLHYTDSLHKILIWIWELPPQFLIFLVVFHSLKTFYTKFFNSKFETS